MISRFQPRMFLLLTAQALDCRALPWYSIFSIGGVCGPTRITARAFDAKTGALIARDEPGRVVGWLALWGRNLRRKLAAAAVATL